MTSSTSSTQRFAIVPWNLPSQAATRLPSCHSVFLPGLGEGAASLWNATAVPRTFMPMAPFCFGMRVARTSPFFTRVNGESSLKSMRAEEKSAAFSFGRSLSLTTR